jgi:thermolysin
MPANATFSVARAVTIQAATDLYGSSSAAVRAITDAWTAVGVN